MNVTRVGIAELKAHLSAYVARAKAGERIIICERNIPAAELVASGIGGTPTLVKPASRPANELRLLQGVPTRFPVDSVALLRESRDQR